VSPVVTVAEGNAKDVEESPPAMNVPAVA